MIGLWIDIQDLLELYGYLICVVLE